MVGIPPALPAASAGARSLRFSVRNRRRVLPATMVALTLLLGASACSSDDNADPPTTVAPGATSSTTTTTTSTTKATTTTTEPKSEEDEVAEAYLAAEAMFYEIAQAPDPEDPRLEQVYGEPNLSYVRDVLRKSKAGGTAVRFSGRAPASQILKVSVKGEDAIVEACIVDDSQQVRDSDGAVVNDNVSSRRSSVELTTDGNHWVAISGETLQTWPDGKGCDR